MTWLKNERQVHPDEGLSRRDLLQAGSLAFLGLSVPGLAAGGGAGAQPKTDRNCIFLLLVGGPGHLDTFDPKPDASSEVRGPFRPIRTNVPGIEISEIFPRTARNADKFAIIRSMHTDAPAVHDIGLQLMQTGRFCSNGIEHPHAGCVHGFLKTRHPLLPPHVVLPGPIGNTGGNMNHGQDAGFLGRDHDSFILNTELSDASSRIDPETLHLNAEPEAVRHSYGRNRFGQSCLLARRLIERGVRFVTVNMFENVFNEVTWDVHGSTPFSTVSSYRRSAGPMFDQAYSTLLEDLAARGLLRDTLVVAAGEFGRTPRINPAGGRDHWPQCWSALLAGGGVKGGQVIGASDEIGAYPRERPTTPAELVATIYHALGIDLHQELPGPLGRRIPLVDAGVQPIHELF